MTKIEIARVKRNGARNRMEMAKEFLKQSDAFHLYRLGEVINTLRSYERDCLLVITDTELILEHIL